MIIALEILRDAIIKTKDYLKSNIPLMKDLLIPLESNRKSLDITFSQALDYVITNKTPFLLVGGDQEFTFTLTKYNLAKHMAMASGTGSDFTLRDYPSDDIKVYSNLPISNSVTIEGNIATVVDESEHPIGIVTADEVVNTLSYIINSKTYKKRILVRYKKIEFRFECS